MLVFLFVLGLLLFKMWIGLQGRLLARALPRFCHTVLYLTTAFPCTFSTDMAHMGPYHIILLFRGRGYKDGRCPMVLQCNVPSLRLISGCNIYFCKNKLSTIRNRLATHPFHNSLPWAPAVWKLRLFVGARSVVLRWAKNVVPHSPFFDEISWFFLQEALAWKEHDGCTCPRNSSPFAVVHSVEQFRWRFITHMRKLPTDAQLQLLYRYRHGRDGGYIIVTHEMGKNFQQLCKAVARPAWPNQGNIRKCWQMPHFFL